MSKEGNVHNPPKCNNQNYIHSLIAPQTGFTCTKTATAQPQPEEAKPHNALTRPLQKQPPDTKPSWQEGRGRPRAYPLVDRKKGLSVLDDTTSDKLCAKKRELATSHRSGKHQKRVKGTNFQTLLCTDALIPCDFRVYHASFGAGRRTRISLRGSRKPENGAKYALMDSWYSSLENLKFIARQGWLFLTRLKSNRLVNPDGKGNVPITASTCSFAYELS